jgi:hypothetical protein
MPLRRAGIVPSTVLRYGPGAGAHRFAKSYALRCVRGTMAYTTTLSRFAARVMPV